MNSGIQMWNSRKDKRSAEETTDGIHYDMIGK
jgi:hypothetical protein